MTLPHCHRCHRQFRVGEEVAESIWMVIDPAGETVAVETRYTHLGGCIT